MFYTRIPQPPYSAQPAFEAVVFWYYFTSYSYKVSFQGASRRAFKILYRYGFNRSEFSFTLVQPCGQAIFSERVRTVSDWLKKRLSYLTPRERAFNGLLHTGTVKSVKELSDWLCYSPRQLSRKFYELTGMNTEQTLLYKKYLSAIQLIHTSGSTLTDIGLSCNFADQSHFIKTFKSFTGLTPKEYKINKSHIPGHIFTNVR